MRIISIMNSRLNSLRPTVICMHQKMTQLFPQQESWLTACDSLVSILSLACASSKSCPWPSPLPLIPFLLLLLFFFRELFFDLEVVLCWLWLIFCCLADVAASNSELLLFTPAPPWLLWFIMLGLAAAPWCSWPLECFEWLPLLSCLPSTKPYWIWDADLFC